MNLRPLFFPEPVKEEIVVVEEVAPPVVDVNTDQKTAPAPTPNSDPPVATVPAAVVATVSTECPVADNNVATYKPEAPKKAGDMVYLQSKTAQTVCYEILREIVREHRQFNPREFRIVAAPDVIDLFLEEENQFLAQLGDFIGKPITLQAEGSFRQEQYDIVLS